MAISLDNDKDDPTKEKASEATYQRPQPSLRKLTKIEDQGMFVDLFSIKSVEFNDSLCDTRVNVNVMSMAIAEKLGIVNIKSSHFSLEFGDASSTTPHGFIQDLMLQLGGCLVPIHFHILEMTKTHSMPLILGVSFLRIVGSNCRFS